jgi:hypothetical protein
MKLFFFVTDTSFKKARVLILTHTHTHTHTYIYIFNMKYGALVDGGEMT